MSHVKRFVGIVALLGGAVYWASPSSADEDTRVRDYTGLNSQRICQVLDEFPTEVGVLGLGEAIVEEGFTAFEAGRIIGDSVLTDCPQHSRLVLRFAAKYLRGETLSA